MASNDWEIPPPAGVTVDHEHKPVLYLPDGRVLVRQAGFRAGEFTMPCGSKKSGGKTMTPGGKKGGGKY